MDIKSGLPAYTGIAERTLTGTYDGDREYLRTHPWISFKVDLREATHGLWMQLGEAWSKCEHIAGVPLRPSTAENLHIMFLAKGARATTAIEGNTLSEEEVTKRLRGELKLPPSKEYLGKEVDNIVDVCNEMLEDLNSDKVPALTPQRVKYLNKRVLDGLPLDEGVQPGEIRTHSVGVARYRGAPRQDCEFLLARLCDWLSGPEFELESLGPGASILRAIIAHLYLAWIHPFGDGNGRTARLIEYQILVASGVPSPAAHLLSNHYNETRTEYYRQLDHSSRAEGGPIAFITYALRGFVDGLRSQIDHIRYQQWQVAWENYVHSVFRDRTSEAGIRRRHLVLDLSQSDEPVRLSKISELTPRLAAAYTSRTGKTLTRDVNVLQRLGLVRRTPKGIVANKEIILAFLPAAAPVEIPRSPQLQLPLDE